MKQRDNEPGSDDGSGASRGQPDDLSRTRLVKEAGGIRVHQGLKAVAVFEFFKGSFLLLIGLGLLSLVHKDVEQAVEDFLRKLHLDPAWYYSRKLLEKAGSLNDARLRLYAVLAFLLSAFRYVQAYGLWTQRHWAEWLTVVTAGFFIPLEVVHLADKFTFLRLGVLLGNVAIVAYIAIILVQNRRAKLAAIQSNHTAGDAGDSGSVKKNVAP